MQILAVGAVTTPHSISTSLTQLVKISALLVTAGVLKLEYQWPSIVLRPMSKQIGFRSIGWKVLCGSEGLLSCPQRLMVSTLSVSMPAAAVDAITLCR